MCVGKVTEVAGIEYVQRILVTSPGEKLGFDILVEKVDSSCLEMIHFSAPSYFMTAKHPEC